MFPHNCNAALNRRKQRKSQGVALLVAVLGLVALVGCNGVTIGPPSFPSCPPTCHH
jgi:hypothetical protein